MEAVTETKPQPTNPMRTIKLAKVTVHIGVGESGEAIGKGQKSTCGDNWSETLYQTSKEDHQRIRNQEGEPIACLTTLRGEQAATFLKRGLEAVSNSLKASSFDENGNFAFGIKEHIEIPGTKYVPEFGIFGMDIIGTLERPGFRIKRRRIRPSRIGKSHRISKEDAIKFVTENFGIQVRGA